MIAIVFNDLLFVTVIVQVLIPIFVSCILYYDHQHRMVFYCITFTVALYFMHVLWCFTVQHLLSPGVLLCIIYCRLVFYYAKKIYCHVMFYCIILTVVWCFIMQHLLSYNVLLYNPDCRLVVYYATPTVLLCFTMQQPLFSYEGAL